METPKPYRPWLIGLSLGVALALSIWPATRWLVRTQFALAVPVPSTRAPWGVVGLGDVSAEQQATHATAARNPDDYRLQLADALTHPPAAAPLTSDIKVARLRELTARFPDNPSLYAAILRFATHDQVKIYRDEEALLRGNPAPQHGVREAHDNTPEHLAAFDRDAAEGERLEPDNAYFPMMRAVGLFAAHRDADALDALGRAAQKPEWTEYYNEELEGEWRLQEETFGNIGVVPQTAQAFAILFPHYARLRAVGNVAVVKAVEAEQAGRVEEGLAIRNAVRQCGSLMRVQSRSAIGCLVGVALTQTSLMRPGGAPAIREAPANEKKHLRAQRLRDYDIYRQRLRDYETYLERIGRTEESAEAHAEVSAGIQVREIVANGLDLEPFGTALQHLIAWWMADLLLLSSALWMLALGGAAALLGRHRRIRTGQGMLPYARRGVALGLLATALLAGSAVLPNALVKSCLWAGVPLCGALVVLLPGITRSERLRSLGVFGLSLAGVGLPGSVFAWQIQSSVAPLAQLVNNLYDDPSASVWHSFYLAGGIAAVPLLTLLTLGALSLVWRVPLSVGLARGFRGCAVPIACTLLLAYGMLVPLTLRQESVIGEGLKRTVQYEGRYIAELEGKEWPGPTH
jgi:hypothetical protein